MARPKASQPKHSISRWMRPLSRIELFPAFSFAPRRDDRLRFMFKMKKKSEEQKAAEADVASFRKNRGPFVVAADTTRMAMVFMHTARREKLAMPSVNFAIPAMKSPEKQIR